VLSVVRDGSFLGVIAEREEQAEWAAKALRQAAGWEMGEPLLPQERLVEDMIDQTNESYPVVNGTAVAGQPIPPLEGARNAARTIWAMYTRPYQMHASLAPSAGAAQWDEEEDRLTVWTHSQGVFPLRATIASVLKMPEENVRVIQVEGSGCYGHNGADDAAFDAVMLARALPGRSVLVRWSRVDENQWEPYGPAMVVKMQASLDADGNHDVWSYAHFGRAWPDAKTSGLLATWHISKEFKKPKAQPALFSHVGSHRNADPLYTFPKRRIVKHFVPDGPLRTSSFRGLGAYANVFAIESFVDELARAAGIDPVSFRLRYLDDERARAVIEAAAEKADWGKDKPADRESFGRAVAFARYKNRAGYVAVVVELTVDRTSGHIQLERAVIAADSGQIVNPDGLSNQLEGGFVQAASMTLREQVKWDREIVTSVDWESYPILRFADAPVMETVLINRPGGPFLGSGEMSTGPTPAAIANAVYDAIGVRLRDLPFLPERVLAAIEG
jgi:nicotinate dehydrogenase subunit B